MIRVDPSLSELIRVDPTRTGYPSWSGPTFVPASGLGDIFDSELHVNIYLENALSLIVIHLITSF